MVTQSTCSIKLYLRLTPETKQVLIAAAQAAHCSVSQFVLTSALARAAETLTERQRLELNAEQWEKFMTALVASARPIPKIQKLFRAPSPFDTPK